MSPVPPGGDMVGSTPEVSATGYVWEHKIGLCKESSFLGPEFSCEVLVGNLGTKISRFS